MLSPTSRMRSLFVAIAFAPDGLTLFPLGAYGRIVQWATAPA